MYQIVKIFGVMPEVLTRLHKVLEGDAVKTEQEVGTDCGGIVGKGKLTCAELLSSKLEESGKTYRVEIKVWASMSCYDPEFTGGKPHPDGKPMTLLPSRKILLSIYNTLGIYPEEEKLIKVIS